MPFSSRKRLRAENWGGASSRYAYCRRTRILRPAWRLIESKHRAGSRRQHGQLRSIVNRSLLRRGRTRIAISHFDGLHRLPVLQALARVQHDSIIRLQPGRNLRVRSAVAGDFDLGSTQASVVHDEYREGRVTVFEQEARGEA